MSIDFSGSLRNIIIKKALQVVYGILSTKKSQNMYPLDALFVDYLIQQKWSSCAFSQFDDDAHTQLETKHSSGSLFHPSGCGRLSTKSPRQYGVQDIWADSPEFAATANNPRYGIPRIE